MSFSLQIDIVIDRGILKEFPGLTFTLGFWAFTPGFLHIKGHILFPRKGFWALRQIWRLLGRFLAIKSISRKLRSVFQNSFRILVNKNDSRNLHGH